MAVPSLDAATLESLCGVLGDMGGEMVRLLLEAGAVPRSMGGIDGMTALSAAAEAGHAEVVQLLLERGGDVHQRDAYDQTALQTVLLKNARAPDERLENVIRILRQAGAR